MFDIFCNTTILFRLRFEVSKNDQSISHKLQLYFEISVKGRTMMKYIVYCGNLEALCNYISLECFRASIVNRRIFFSAIVIILNSNREKC